MLNFASVCLSSALPGKLLGAGEQLSPVTGEAGRELEFQNHVANTLSFYVKTEGIATA